MTFRLYFKVSHNQIRMRDKIVYLNFRCIDVIGYFCLSRNIYILFQVFLKNLLLCYFVYHWKFYLSVQHFHLGQQKGTVVRQCLIFDNYDADTFTRHLLINVFIWVSSFMCVCALSFFLALLAYFRFIFVAMHSSLVVVGCCCPRRLMPCILRLD